MSLGTQLPLRPVWPKLFSVKWTGKFVVLLMALSVFASPLMACMLPDTALTQEERECCQDMDGRCGQMDMPASHSCCKLTVRDFDPYLVNSRVSMVHQPVLILPHSSNHVFLPQDLSRPEFLLSDHSPPLFLPDTSSILRI